MLNNFNVILNYLYENGNHLLGTIAMILVLSIMIAVLLKLNYKDLWTSKKENEFIEDKKLASSRG